MYAHTLPAILLQNASLLLVLVVVLDLATPRLSPVDRRTGRVMVGVLVGILGSLSILNAHELLPGVVVDTRTVVLAACGLYFGTGPTLIALTMTAASRWYLGGDAAVVGIVTIFAAAGLGLAWRAMQRHRLAQLDLVACYLFGLVVHLVALASVLLLPWHVAMPVLERIALPVMVLYPALLTLVCALLRNRLRAGLDRAVLQENEERLRLATDAAGLGVYDVDIPSGRITVNDRYRELVGESDADFVETLDRRAARLHPDDRDAVVAAFKAHLDGERGDFRREYRQAAPGGGWNWILSVGRVVGFDRQGRPLRMTGMDTDITRIKHAEKVAERSRLETHRLLAESDRAREVLSRIGDDLKASERRFRQLFDVSPVPLFYLDPRGRVLDINERFRTTFGHPREALPTLDDWLALACPNESERRRLRSAWLLASRRGRQGQAVIGSTDTRIVCQDGSVIDALVSVTHDGENLLGAFFDITARKRAERSLRASRDELKATINAIPDLMLDVDIDGVVHAVHSRRGGWPLVTAAKATGERLADLLPAEAANAVLAALHQAVQRGESHGRQFRLARPSGELWFELSVARKEGEPPAPARFIVLSRDITKRRHAERSLAEGERQMSMLIGNLPGAVYRCLDDSNYTMEFVSDGIGELTGYPAEAFIEERVSYQELIFEEDRRNVRDQVRAALSRGDSFELTYRIVTASGERRWVWERGAAADGPSGAARRLEGYLADITGQVVASDTLALQARRAEAMMTLPRIAENTDEVGLMGHALALVQSLTDSHMSCLHRVDAAGSTLVAVAWSGFAVGDGEPGSVPLADAAAWMEVVRDRQPVIRNDASVRQVPSLAVSTSDWVAIVPVVENEGAVLLVTVAGAAGAYRAMDIESLQLVASETWSALQRRRSEAELHKLSQAVAQSSESVVITDLDGRIEYVNETFERMTGYRADEVLGENPRLLDAGRTPRGSFEALWRALARGKPWKGRFWNRRKDGSEYVAFAVISPMRQRDGRITHYVAVEEDITEKQRVGEELDRHRYHLEELVVERTRQLAEARTRAEDANRAKSEFLANMSHEIRTPMNAIIGLTHLLRRDTEDPAEQARLSQIDTAATHLLRLIDDVLDLSKIEAGKLNLEDTSFTVGDILAQIRDLVADQAQRKGIGITTSLHGVEDPVRGDPTRLRQALLNLAANAVKFTETGTIVLRARMVQHDADSATICFEVEDTGIGIEADVLSTLFEPFQQADASTTRRFGGTGLGLVITARLARLMGGGVQVDSVPGRGSVFRMTVRLAHGAVESVTRDGDGNEDAAELLAGHHDAHLLLVEDDDISREVACELIEGVGPRVDLASNGREALAKAADRRYDLVLMDLQMPDMDGAETTRALRRLPGYAKVPVLALTGNAFADDRRRCLDAGMNDFIAKPVDPDRLFARLAHWLDDTRPGL